MNLVPSLTADLRPPTSRPCLSALRIIGVTIVTYFAFAPSRSNVELKLDGTEPTVSNIKSNLQHVKYFSECSGLKNHGICLRIMKIMFKDNERN